ncbi:MAG: lysylphosphatidylglycerol synthase domain-containing protein [Prochlorococcus marinus CUG1439]|uniref:lysylphosphatidylglycerol synthase domain-containing protein n=1 Tax=Prochlorococcus sp. MIT 1314 TaxID=3096220 RepID=UPI001B276F92|nr:lysylphosphatidylglycerol synthase domain-containing protein [Prochlorococcus sp. MIT 1314]MCR8539814.1 lysylphosphatidylglycerol synthase domain-containing protein [Prochlorococcus marinus CUG1439]
MIFNIKIQSYWKFFKKINFSGLKTIFFLSSLLYFCIYFFYNLDQISFDINLERNGINLFLSFLFCVLSIFLNAYAWKYIIKWFGKECKGNNLISFYILTNILKYVPGGIWHFVERLNFIQKRSNPQIAFYSTLIEPYFMLSGSFLLASLGVIFSPLYFFFILPLVFLNRKLIYIVLKRLESLKGKAFEVLRLSNSKYQFEKRINIISFFPTKAILLEIGFVLSKFLGFYICLNTFNTNLTPNIIFLLVVFSLSWSLGLIVPAAPSGIGVFEACLLFFVGRNIPQNIILVAVIYFRVISTFADLLLSLPFLTKKLLKKT